MTIRHLYIARHGDADPFGELTDVGRQQCRLLGKRLAHIPMNKVWHSPLSRAVASAREVASCFPAAVPMAAAGELIDHVPYVPEPAETPASWLPFFDGFSAVEAEMGHDLAVDLVARFGSFANPPGAEAHEVLITHAYPIAWLIRDALGAPEVRWLGLNAANTALTVIEHRPGALPAIIMFNDMSHLPPELRWTGFPDGAAGPSAPHIERLPLTRYSM